jgi:hypothetical protein
MEVRYCAIVAGALLAVGCTDGEPTGECIVKPRVTYDDCGGGEPPQVSYQETLEEWLEIAPAVCAQITEGECLSGKRFLYLAGGFVSQVRYFDETGQLLGQATSTDVISSECGNVRGCSAYFTPTFEAVRCLEPQGQPLCGDAEPQLYLPFADGEP